MSGFTTGRPIPRYEPPAPTLDEEREHQRQGRIAEINSELAALGKTIRVLYAGPLRRPSVVGHAEALGRRDELEQELRALGVDVDHAPSLPPMPSPAAPGEVSTASPEVLLPLFTFKETTHG